MVLPQDSAPWMPCADVAPSLHLCSAKQIHYSLVLLRAAQPPMESIPAVPAMQEQIVFNLQLSQALAGCKLNGYDGHGCLHRAALSILLKSWATKQARAGQSRNKKLHEDCCKKFDKENLE